MVMDIARRYVRALYSRFARTLVPSAPLSAVLADWGVNNVTTVDLGVDPAIFPSFRPPGRFRPRRAEAAVGRDTAALRRPPVARERTPRRYSQAFTGCADGIQGRFHLLIVGDGNQRKPRRPRCRKKTGAVTWQPYCSDPRELARLYRAADLFVHPGVQETFGSGHAGEPGVRHAGRRDSRQLHGPHRVQRPRPLGGGKPARIPGRAPSSA